MDLTKWGLFGASPASTKGCSAGYNGHGSRCASQVTEGHGYLSVTATAKGVTGGLYARTRPFKYGRVEIRERAVPLTRKGVPYNAVPLLWPQDDNVYSSAEIDFAERSVGAQTANLYVHHDNDQSSFSHRVDTTQFHNYAIDWEPGFVTWYVDALKICTIKASVSYFERTNGGAQLDMFANTGTVMEAARQDVDWIHMFASPATRYA